MTTARINVQDRFEEMTLEIERITVEALDAAALEAAAVAEQQANSPKPIAHFTVIPAHNIGTGYSSGVRAGPLSHIFDKGSLGKRSARLKRPRGNASWQVNRGANPYTAHRSDDLSGKGVAGRNIFNTARKAGKAVLLQRLLSR